METGNLGVGHNIDSIASGWKAVVKYPETASNDCRLLAVWDGALSCGGGHCIALLDSCV